MPSRNLDNLSTTSSNIDHESQAMQELAAVKRKYRIMENERKAKTLETNTEVARQNRLISCLLKEQEELKTELLLAKSSAVEKKDSNNVTDIKDLYDAQVCYVEIVAHEKTETKKLKNKIKSLEEEIEKYQQQNGGAISSHERNVSLIKKTRVLENRLNTSTVQFNKLLTENNELRENIEHYRSQRKVFNNIYKRLMAKIEQQKSKIAEVIDSATHDYDVRDEARAKMVSLMDRNNTDYNHYVSEYKEMTRIIAHESELHNFMNKKNCELGQLAKEVVQKRKDNFESKSENQQEQELMRYEKVLDQMIEILGETAGEKLRKIISTPGPEELKIKELTDAIVPICDRYNKTEEQNYSLFQFVNEISSDVKRMKSKQAAFTSKTKLEATKITDTVNSCDNAVKLLNEHVKEHTSQEQAVQKALNELNNTYNSQKKSIKKLFDSLSCSKAEIESMLESSSNEISESSLNLYLSSIEETINDMVHRHLSNIDIDRESDSRKSRNRVVVSQQQNTRKTSKDSGATKKPKTAGLNDVPNISVDFLDQHFDDLDKIPLDSTALKERAKYLITEKERARNVQSANSARKTPKTPGTRKGSLDSKNRKIRI